MIENTKKNPISPFIKDRIPNFIKSQYPSFYRLLSDFYEWLEGDENYLQVLTEFASNQEVNREVEPYIDLMLNELGWTYNGPMVADKKFVVQTLREFYLSRGSKNSFNHLFRLIYNQPAVIDYPRKKLMVLSDAEYTNDTMVLVTAENLGTKAYETITSGGTLSSTIKGVLSNTVLSINKIVPITYDTNYLLIFLEPDNKGFFPDEPVIISIDDVQIYENIKNTLTIDIVAGGKYYQPGDIVDITGAGIKGLIRVKRVGKGNVDGLTIEDGGIGYAVGNPLLAGGSDGSGFYGRVKAVDGSGTITEVEILNRGYNYTVVPTITVVSETGSGATIIASSNEIGSLSAIEVIDPYWSVGSSPTYTIETVNGTGATLTLKKNSCIYNGQSSHKNAIGVLGINGILHDSHYYQEYSYELTTQVNAGKYAPIVDDLLHPVGFVRFSVYEIEDVIYLPVCSLDANKFNIPAGIIDWDTITIEDSISFDDYTMWAPYAEIQWTMISFTGEETAVDLETCFANILFNGSETMKMNLDTLDMGMDGSTSEVMTFDFYVPLGVDGYDGTEIENVYLETFELQVDFQHGSEGDSSELTTYPA